MSGISKPMAHSTTSANPFGEVPVEQIVAVTPLVTPAIANYPGKFQLACTLVDKTVITFTYATQAALTTAQSAFRTLVSSNF